MVLGAVFAPRVTTDLKAGGYAEYESEAAQGLNLLEQEFGASPSSLTIVFSSETLTVDDPRFSEEVEAALADLGKLPEVREVVTFFSSGNSRMVSQDRGTTYATVGLNVDLDEARSLMSNIRDSLDSTSLKDVQMLVTGQPAVFSDIESISTRDLKRAEMYAFPLCLVALVLVFGTLVAAGIPLAIGGTSLVSTLGIVYLVSQLTDMSIFVLNIVGMLGIGIAISYSLLLVSRFREEIRNKSLEESVVTTVSTAGKAVFYSGVTTMIGILGLMSFKFMMLRSLGIGGAIVVFVSVMAALTLLPAILAVLGPRVNALSILPRLLRPRFNFWHGLAMWVMRHPVIVLAIVVPFLLALGSPFLGIKLGGAGVTSLPESAPARQGYEIMKEKFGEGETSPIMIAVNTQSNVLEAGVIGSIYDFTREIASQDGVTRVDSIVNLDPQMSKQEYQLIYANPSLIDDISIKKALDELTTENTTLISVVSNYPPISEEANELVRKIRGIELGDEVDVYVTGLTAEIMDIVSQMYHDFPRVLIFIMVATYLALMFLFRSVILPLKAILMNVMSILASYGALVFIFQQGHLSSLFNFTAVGSTESSLPIILFCVLFGLSMDYEVFLLARIKETYSETRDNTSSVALGLERTGRIITSTALIMILVTGTFGFTDILLVKAMGVGIALAVLVDSTVVRALFAPATMRLLGRWNWWSPGILRRFLPQ
ncbi:MMPL family transporter [Chloroflexota bacterium]